MPKVYSENGQFILAEVDDGLYRHFLDEVLIEERSIEDTINSLSPKDQAILNGYIIHRLAQVDPGHVDKVMSTDEC